MESISLKQTQTLVITTYLIVIPLGKPKRYKILYKNTSYNRTEHHIQYSLSFRAGRPVQTVNIQFIAMPLSCCSVHIQTRLCKKK